MKKCITCNTEKPLSSFYRRVDSPDGYRNDCKQCRMDANNRTRDANREQYRMYYRSYYKEKRVEINARTRRQYRAEFPERYKANQAIQVGIKNGTIVAQPCWVCGEKAEAHHSSYAPDAWLDVTWLCSKHHKQCHAMVNHANG